jgi:hypothetical protein
MSLNFFDASCQYPPVSETLFGLIDKQDGAKAEPVITDPDTWVAEVKNEAALPVVFTAIDKCVLGDGDYAGHGRCDGMLTTARHLYLVELKDSKDGGDPKRQLISTIDLLRRNHDISMYRLKKAFACNKRRKRFMVIDNEENLRLFRQTGFRLDVQATIVII